MFCGYWICNFNDQASRSKASFTLLSSFRSFVLCSLLSVPEFQHSMPNPPSLVSPSRSHTSHFAQRPSFYVFLPLFSSLLCIWTSTCTGSSFFKALLYWFLPCCSLLLYRSFIFSLIWTRLRYDTQHDLMTQWYRNIPPLPLWTGFYDQFGGIHAPSCFFFLIGYLYSFFTHITVSHIVGFNRLWCYILVIADSWLSVTIPLSNVAGSGWH